MNKNLSTSPRFSRFSRRNYSTTRTSARLHFDLVARLVSLRNKISIGISGRDFLRPVTENCVSGAHCRAIMKVARINKSQRGSIVMSCKFLIKRPTFETISYALHTL